MAQMDELHKLEKQNNLSFIRGIRIFV